MYNTADNIVAPCGAWVEMCAIMAIVALYAESECDKTKRIGHET